MKEYGLTLNHRSKISSRAISRRKSSIFFDTIRSYSEKKMEQLNSTVSNSIYETIILKYSIGLMNVGSCLAAGGGSKRRYQYCSHNLGSIIYLRALQGHSGGNLIDLTLQDNVLIGPGIFPYFYHVGSNFNLHSFVSNGLIPGGQNLSRRQIVFFSLIDPRNENHKDPEYIDYSAPRRARYLQNAWKRHQDTVFGVDIDLGIREGSMFYQTRSNAIILQGTLPSHYISKS